MKACKRIGIFLLLGVLIVGILISGCTPESDTEPDPNAIAFRDLPGVNMDNIDKISIYYGSASTRELIQAFDNAEAIAEFQTTFKRFYFTKIDSPSMLSSIELPTAEYDEAFGYITDETTYRIVAELGDGTQWYFSVAENKHGYYFDSQFNIYFSTGETEYISKILDN